MKKLFAFATALVFALSLNAKKVTFDFTNPTALGVTAPEASAGTEIAGTTVTVDGVAMTSTNGSTATRIWNSNGSYDLRIYKSGGSLTFTAEDDITAVEFSGTAIEFSEVTGKTWTGSAKSVTFTATATCKVTSIILTVGEAAVVWVPDTVTVTAARNLIDGSDTHDHYVKGVVAGQPFNLFDDMKDGKVSFWLTDIATPADSIEAYQLTGANKAKWATIEAAWEELRVGDTVLVYAASLAKYNEIYEIASGNYDSKLGANPNPPAIQYPDTVTATEAFEIAKALEEPAANGKSTTTPVEYIIGGYAVRVWDRNSDKTWSFGMADVENGKYDFQASNATITDGNDTVITNDYMYVRGKIAKRKTNSGNLQYQVYKGTAVHGEPIAIEMDTIGAAEALTRAQALPVDGSELVCVEAYVAQIKTAYSSEHGNITVWLNDDPSSTYGNIQAYRAACSAEDGAAIVEHCRVRVVGNIVHTTYEQDGATKDSYQIAQGAKLTLLNGAGVEQTIVLDKAVKMIENGQLIIEKNGVKYNAQGAVVK